MKVQPETRPKENVLFPVFFKLEQLPLLIVGGGKVALEKVNAVVQNSPGAKITLVSPEILPEIKHLSRLHHIKLIQRPFFTEDLIGKKLVIVAVNNKEISTYVKKEASQFNVLVNVADKPEECDFYLSSVVKKGNLKIAISTNGQSPTMAKRLKEVLHENIPNEVEDGIEKLNTLRTYLKGDFAYKVNELNRNTEVLIKKKQRTKWKLFKQGLIYLAFALSLMITGHLVLDAIGIQTLYTGIGELFVSLDPMFIWFVLAGAVAAFIDGLLGMAYGVSATTFLLSLGVGPAAASMSVHASEIVTSGVSGLMHLKFGNVNRKLFRAIVLPGVGGAIIGAFALSVFENYEGYIKPLVAIYTLILGAIIILKAVKRQQKKRKVRKLGPLAFTGGFLDSVGGGGWGPIVSSTLIADGRNPLYTIGTVNLTEFFVALSSSVAFFTLIGTGYWQIIVGLIIGGSITAPLAAGFAGKLPVKTLMLSVGILVILISLRILFLSVL